MVNECGFVSAHDYGRLTAKHEGLYALFQHYVDPNRIVYILGTVEDESVTQATKLTPTILEAFLGYSIVQVRENSKSHGIECKKRKLS